MKTFIQNIISEAIKKLHYSETVELTPSRGFGDYATNVAFKIASSTGEKPVVVANQVAAALRESEHFAKVEVAEPGFINLFLSPKIYTQALKNILLAGDCYGSSGPTKRKINVEYVSTNPTGLLHIGHARNAAVGSTLVNILRFGGNQVIAEYYVNDLGNQIDNLRKSVFWRMQEVLGMSATEPEDPYRGLEIITCARDLIKAHPSVYNTEMQFEVIAKQLRADALEYMVKNIKRDLELFGVKFDKFFYESALIKGTNIKEALAILREKGAIYIKDKAMWLRTTAKGDDKDRVLFKADGSCTYFMPDIAYHHEKLKHSTELIDIWGADHIGYLHRMSVALSYMGIDPKKLHILLIQLVKLTRDGEEVKMSKRSGVTYALSDLIDEIGSDATRWYLLDRANSSEITFDINQALSASVENPVFNIRYTHARAAQLLVKSEIKHPRPGHYEPKEVVIINLLLTFPSLIKSICTNYKVHLMPQFLMQLASEFNSWYANERILGSPRESEMLALVQAVKNVMALSLKLLGISAPDQV